MNKISIIVLLCTILSTCEKNNIEKAPESLSEIIYGKWERREIIDIISYSDYEYHELPESHFAMYEFFEDGTFLLVARHRTVNFDTIYSGVPFEINEIDSIISIDYRLNIRGYSQDTLDLRGFGRHGEFGSKLFKIE